LPSDIVIYLLIGVTITEINIQDANEPSSPCNKLLALG